MLIEPEHVQLNTLVAVSIEGVRVMVAALILLSADDAVAVIKEPFQLTPETYLDT